MDKTIPPSLLSNFRCRLCAKQNPCDNFMKNLAYDENSKKSFIEKLKYFGGEFYEFFSNFDNKLLPQIVCGACYEALEASHQFFLDTENAKLIFSKLCEESGKDVDEESIHITTTSEYTKDPLKIEPNDIYIKKENDSSINVYDNDIIIEIQPNEIQVKKENDTSINVYDDDITIELNYIKTEASSDATIKQSGCVDNSSKKSRWRRKAGQPSKQESLNKAVEAVKHKEMKVNLAATTFGIPLGVLIRSLGSPKPNPKCSLNKNNIRKHKKQIKISPKIEKQLIEHFKFLESRHFIYRYKDVIETAFKLIDLNNLPHPYDQENKNYAKIWYEDFINRNVDCMRNRRGSLSEFLDTYRDLVTSLNIGPDRIYNVVESATICTADRKFCLNAVCGVNAEGTFIPPVVFFQCENKDLPVRSNADHMIVAVQDVSLTPNEYLTWLKHFQRHTQTTTKNKAILITNGLPIHRDIIALKFAKENGIEIVCLSTFNFQPLADFYDELKTQVSKELTKIPRHLLKRNEFLKFFFSAFKKGANKEIACQGFQIRGLWPLDSKMFFNVILEYRRKHWNPVQFDLLLKSMEINS